MRIKTLMNILILGSLVLGVFAVLAPTASAQQQGGLTITVTPPSDPIKPLRAPTIVSGSVSMVADGTVFTGVTGVQVTYSVSKAPSWATVIISPATDIFAPGQPQPGTQVTVTKPISISITTTDLAPAFAPDSIEISATSTPTPGGKAVNGKQSFPISADYFSIVDVNLQEAVKIDRPQQPVVFNLKVTNFGNANTKVTVTPGDHSENLQVAAPVPVILQSKQTGGSQISTDIPLTIQTPYHNGYLNEVGQATYKITSAYALDSKLTGDASQVTVVLTTRGFYVPGFEPVLAIGSLAVVGAILAFRRRA